MVCKFIQQSSPIVKLEYACIVGLALLAITAHTHARGVNIDTSQSEERVNETSDALQTVIEGVTHVFFAFGAETIDHDLQSSLLGLVEQAKANPNSTILIEAHTDNRGWALGNLELSRIRARSVAKELISHGINVARMRAFAFGESRPVARNSTAEGRRMNRRVEISLTP